MPVIYINTFQGERPKVDPRLLPNESAQEAKGCHFYSGNLSALNQPLSTDETVLSNAKTIFLYDDTHWFSWDKRVNAVNSPVANDPWNRVYFTGDGYPKVTTNAIFSGASMPAAAYKLGVQAPEQVITATVTEGANSNDFDINELEDRYYTHTFVTGAGEEGAPGEPSEKIVINSPFDENTSVTLALSAPNVNISDITHRRIYRSVTGGGISDYLLVAEVEISATEYIDSYQGEELGVSLDTYDYETPPEGLSGLVSMANGILAGFFDNTLCFSEPYLPYAWPTKYQLTTQDNIVVAIAIGNSLAVLTEGNPYIFSGVLSANMTGRKVEASQACVSERSAIIIDGTVIYASPDGLVALASDGARVITDSILTRKQWASYNPSTIEAYVQEGRYLGFYGTGLDKAFIFDVKTGDLRHFDATAYCGFNSLINDALYIAEGGSLSKWESSSDKYTYTWRSKRYETVNGSISCGLVKCDDITKVGLTIFADGVAVLEFDIGDVPSTAFRLPDIRANNWEVELTGTADVYSIVLAESMTQIRQVLNG